MPSSPITPSSSLYRRYGFTLQEDESLTSFSLGQCTNPSPPASSRGGLQGKSRDGSPPADLPEGLWPGRRMGAEQALTNRMAMCNPVVHFSPLVLSSSSPKCRAFNSQPLSSSGLERGCLRYSSVTFSTQEKTKPAGNGFDDEADTLQKKRLMGWDSVYLLSVIDRF